MLKLIGHASGKDVFQRERATLLARWFAPRWGAGRQCRVAAVRRALKAASLFPQRGSQDRSPSGQRVPDGFLTGIVLLQFWLLTMTPLTVHPRVPAKASRHVTCRDVVIELPVANLRWVVADRHPKYAPESTLFHENILIGADAKRPTFGKLPASNAQRQPGAHSPQHAQRDLARQQLSPNVTRLDVHAPRLAHIRQPSQFRLVVRLGDHSLDRPNAGPTPMASWKPSE